jgi:hypothetical protein
MAGQNHDVLITKFKEGDYFVKCKCGWKQENILSESAARGGYSTHIAKRNATPGKIKVQEL